jgi:hypothetical protein
LQPTRILGTSGQKWCTSEHHYQRDGVSN